VPRKNLRSVAGRPLIAWTIEAARRARSLDRILVTTDDADIAETARHLGAEVPFMRPADLSSDDVPGVMPVIHAVTWLDEHESYRPDRIILLQPTSPLRTAEDIDAALALQDLHPVSSIVSVSPAPHHPSWFKMVDEHQRLHDILAEDPDGVRQRLPVVYALNGAIYIVPRAALLERRALYGSDTRAYVMPPERSLDVDSEWDLHLAALILQAGASHVP
jgi:N-acylneuraminate cytidylyltransferase/CMP-N,N'-diacetyllegionaminic acid synthase